MVILKNNNSFQGPKLDDYVSKLPYSDSYYKTKLNIPKTIKDRITWQQFEDDIISKHINEYILNNDSDLKLQFPDGLASIRDQISDTSDFFNGKLFVSEWNEIAFKIWDAHKENYLSVLSFLDKIFAMKSNQSPVLAEQFHYLSTKSQTLIPLRDFLAKRKPIHIKKRWLNVLDPYLRKGKWSEEEDALLVAKFNEYGPHWSKIALEIPRRTVDQCSKRFHEALDPDKSTKNHVDWSTEEDFRLINALKELGTKWRSIAMKLNSSRSALNCRNRWRKIINGYIKGKSNPSVAALIDELSRTNEFEDIIKLRQEIEMKEAERMQRKMNKVKSKTNKSYTSAKVFDDDDVVSEENVVEGYDDEDDEDDDDNFDEQSDLEPSYVDYKKRGGSSRDEPINFNLAKNTHDPEHNNLSTSILIGESLNRPEPSLVSNFLEQQFDQQQLTGHQSLHALSPGPYHTSMSPPPNLSLGLMQTPKPHDIISSLRTTQLPMNLLANPVPRVNTNIMADNTISPSSTNTNKFHKNTPIQSVKSSNSLNKSGRPSSVPLKSNTTEWKFQLKQKNLTLSSGNITSERLVSLLIEQAKLNNLKISIHQHIHNHYMPILDNSEHGSSITTTPGSEQNLNNNIKGQVSVGSHNGSASSSNNVNGSFGTKVIKDMNEIGAYRVRHFKQLDVKKVPKLASSDGSSNKRRNGSVSGSSPVSLSRKRVKFNSQGVANTNSTSNTNNNSARSSIVGINEYENSEESFDFWDSLMHHNPLSHLKENKTAKTPISAKLPSSKQDHKEIEEPKKDSSSGNNSNDLDYYMLGFNPS
ncbi:hypothetical protein QEN19_000795 [Hanseniaspora menglaensis]